MVSYNYGEDPVNLLLSAVLWEQVGEVIAAWVDWLRLRGAGYDVKRPVGAAGVSAARQVARIDEGLGFSEQGIFPPASPTPACGCPPEVASTRWRFAIAMSTTRS